MIIELEGIVLKREKISPLDSYLKIFTREMGLIDVFSKGGNHPKSVLNRLTQPFVYGHFQLNGKNEFSLSQGTVTESFYALRENLDALYKVSFFSKLLLEILPPRASQKRIYEALVNSVYVMNKFPSLYPSCKLYLYGAVLYDMGIYPLIEEGGRYLTIEEGTISTEGEIELSEEALKILKELKGSSFKTFVNTRFEEAPFNELTDTLSNYLSYHLDIPIDSIPEE
ncbi:DNA repair protein RecO [Guggenheimella bovis]